MPTRCYQQLRLAGLLIDNPGAMFDSDPRDADCCNADKSESSVLCVVRWTIQAGCATLVVIEGDAGHGNLET